MCKVLQASHKIAVVQDVVVAEGCPLWKACCAAGVLDIDRVIELLLALSLAEFLVAHLCAHRYQLVPVKHARHLL